MGNNHVKYFGLNKRKVVILGPEASGKSTLFALMKGEDKAEIWKEYMPTDKFSNSQLKLLKNS